MEKTICFRKFEERDIDFIYKCKNNEKLNKFIVGDWHPFSYDEAEKWVHGCMKDDSSYKFWAVCTNDEEKNIIGWVSLSDIDITLQTANFHGIVIGNPDFQDGTAWVECYQLIFEVVFSKMKFRRLTGSHLSIHPSSGIIAACMFMQGDYIEKNYTVKDGINTDLIHVSIDSDTYFKHLNNGDYEYNKILNRMLNKYKHSNKLR